MLAHRDHPHAQGFRALGDRATDAAEAYETDGCAGNLTHSRQFVPQYLLPPDVLLLQAHRARDFLGQRKDQRDDMLRHHRPVHFARVGENNLAVDEFRKNQLMDRRRRRVNPSQSLCRRNLRGTN